jgi:hypothetical protein
MIWVSRTWDTPATLEPVTHILDPNVIPLDTLPTWAEDRPFLLKREKESNSAGYGRKVK